MKRSLVIILGIALCAAGCISEYTPPGVRSMENLLVVDGTITDSVTRIRLSLSVALDTPPGALPLATGATVRVVGDNGDQFTSPGINSDKVYEVANGTLSSTVGYKLVVEYKGKRYESDFRTPLGTPPIDDITFTKAGAGRPVKVHVTTVGSNAADQTRFYRWAYDEVWEISSARDAQWYFVPAGTAHNSYEYGPRGTAGGNPYYYCWKKVPSSELILNTSLDNSENRLRRKEIAQIPATDRRFQLLYRLELRQNMVRKDAYDYFYNVQKNSEETGTIFSPAVSEMHGNIVCVTDPDTPAIGFVEVSRTAKKYAYVEAPNDFDETVSPACTVMSTNEYPPAGSVDYLIDVDDDPDSEIIVEYRLQFDNGFGMPANQWPGPATRFDLFPRRCLDCTYQFGDNGTKDKPADWPNDHR